MGREQKVSLNVIGWKVKRRWAGSLQHADRMARLGDGDTVCQHPNATPGRRDGRRPRIVPDRLLTRCGVDREGGPLAAPVLPVITAVPRAIVRLGHGGA